MKALSGKEMVKLLERHGWALTRVKGSHHIFTKPGHKATISVPVHGNQSLKIGLQKAILKDAGISEDEIG